jgi:purine-binding chemotaxis protein CheW
MVDLVKIRKKKAKQQADEASDRSAGVPPAGQAASPPPVLAPSEPTGGGSGVPSAGGEDASGPAGETPALPKTAQISKLETFKAEAGKRRAFETAKSDEATSETQLELLTFIIAGEQYAVDIERIVEIVTPRAVTRIPNADTSVVGIMSLRGTIVTLVDVRRKLRHREAGDGNDDTRIVVVDFHREIIGFLVDRVLRVVKAAAGDIERHPVVHATELDDSVRGVFRTAGALTILLDLDKLLDHGALAARSA